MLNCANAMLSKTFLWLQYITYLVIS